MSPEGLYVCFFSVSDLNFSEQNILRLELIFFGNGADHLAGHPRSDDAGGNKGTCSDVYRRGIRPTDHRSSPASFGVSSDFQLYGCVHVENLLSISAKEKAHLLLKVSHVKIDIAFTAEMMYPYEERHTRAVQVFYMGMVKW